MAKRQDNTLSTPGAFGVRRRVRVAAMDSALLSRLRELPGVIDVVADGNRVQLHYDRSRIGFGAIERVGNCCSNPVDVYSRRSRR